MPRDDTKPASSPSSPDAEQRDNARVGYQVAASLMTTEGNLIWARFGAMLVTHSVILTAIGLISGSTSGVKLIAQLGLPSVGVVLCAVWAMLNQRGYDNYTYWILSMRELEETYLSPAVQTISRGAILATNHPVSLTVGGQTKTHRTRLTGRVKVATLSYMVIGIFALLYIGVLILFIANRP